MKPLLMCLPVLLMATAHAEDAFSLPAVGDGTFDAAVVLLRDGLLPLEPWEGLTDSQREEFWTLGFRGILVQRAAWAGYVICGPGGSAGKLLEYARSICEPEQTADVSPPAQLLGLVPLSRCGPVVILFTDGCESHWPPDSLPLRMSSWLSTGPDTLIISGDWENSAFLFTADAGEATGTATWEGSGYQPVPLSSGSATIAVVPVSGGTPSDLGNLDLARFRADPETMAPWTGFLEEMDAVVRELAPPVYPGDFLVWLRGSGTGPRVPLWTSTPSPSPPARATGRIDMPDLTGNGWNPVPSVDSTRPMITSTPFPGSSSGEGMALISAGILERMISRDRSILPDDVSHFSIEPGDDGRLVLFLGWTDGPGSGVSAMDNVVRELSPLVLSIQDGTAVHNATVRASVRLGRELTEPADYALSRELGTVLGVL